MYLRGTESVAWSVDGLEPGVECLVGLALSSLVAMGPLRKLYPGAIEGVTMR